MDLDQYCSVLSVAFKSVVLRRWQKPSKFWTRLGHISDLFSKQIILLYNSYGKTIKVRLF